MPDKMRVLRISHSSVVPEYRERDRALIRRFPIELELIMPVRWQHIGVVGDSGASVTEKFPVHRAQTVGTGSVPLFAFDPFPIIKVLKEFRPHIVDVHEEPYSISGFECVYLTKFFAPDSGCIFYSAQNILKKYPPPFAWTEQYVYRNTQAAYPCSQGVADVLRAKGYSKPVFVIPLGLDPRSVASTIAYAGETIRIGYAGRLTTSKGVHLALSALSRLPADLSWEFHLAGSGPEERKLRQQAAELDIGHRIKWHGELSTSEMPSFYRSCDLFLVPSLTSPGWKEQFGRVASEAMACGCVVIVSDSGSLPEVVSDAGVVVPEGNVDALSDAISQLCSAADRRLKLAQAARERALACYTWDRVAELMYQMYCSVLPPHLVCQRD